MDEKKLPAIYSNANIGTENLNQDDFNTPTLKVVQSNTQGIDSKKEGAYYRSDIKEQFDELDVNLVYVTSNESENYNKTGMETVKIYYGFYAGTNDPFKMYVRGWGLSSHRQFQTEFATLKHKYNIPMLALIVKLTTEKKSGTIAENGKAYVTYMPVFNIQKDEKGVPSVEMDINRVNFLIDAAHRFAEISSEPTVHDDEQNEIPVEEEIDIDEVDSLLNSTSDIEEKLDNK